MLAVSGPTASLLTAERTALNFLQRLSGIATLSRRFADAAAGTGVRVVDTRKTTPGFRALEKYAVRCGGCHNHRSSLGEHVLIKDNHIAAAGSLARAVAHGPGRGAPPLPGSRSRPRPSPRSAQAVRGGRGGRPPRQHGARRRSRAAVAIIGGAALVEVSGGVRLETLARLRPVRAST